LSHSRCSRTGDRNLPKKKKKKKTIPKFADLPPGSDRFLSKDEVMAMLGISYPTLWDWCHKNHFVKARVLGMGDGFKTKIGWLQSEVEAWMKSRPQRMGKGRKSRTASRMLSAKVISS
jgi:predicted DNA-binding transcriptional regulator AlpA